MKELAPAAPRALLHTRQVQCTGWEREDGLFDIEGRLSDVHAHDTDGSRGNAVRKAGEPIHLMSLRITLDEHFSIVAAQDKTAAHRPLGAAVPAARGSTKQAGNGRYAEGGSKARMGGKTPS